ncbi:MAG: DUF2853 family protein [Bacteroidia bacterium]|jgi:hypothetical protein|nr:DUF2853 family protein [Bacteroidia bacterium]
MSKRDELIALYAKELKEKAGVKADMNLLTKVTIGCGPSIYNRDAASVSCSDEGELKTVKNNYLIKKLGLKDGPKLDAAIKKVCEQLGSSNRNKYRAMFYYLLCKEVGKESVYK